MSFPISVLTIVAADEAAHRRLSRSRDINLPCIGGETDEEVDSTGYWFDNEESEEVPPPPMVALPAEWPAPHGG